MLYIVSLGAMIFDSLHSSTELHYITRDNARARLGYGHISGSVENLDLIYAVESQCSCRFPLVYTTRRKSPGLGVISLPQYVGLQLYCHIVVTACRYVRHGPGLTFSDYWL